MCVFNACDFDNTQKSNYYNDDLLSRRISVVCKISLSLLERGGHNDNKKKTQTRKKGKPQIEWLLIFFASKKPLSAALFGCFRVRRIIWCVNSRLFSLLNRLVQRDTQRHEEEDKEEGGRGRLCVLWW